MKSYFKFPAPNFLDTAAIVSPAALLALVLTLILPYEHALADGLNNFYMVFLLGLFTPKMTSRPKFFLSIGAVLLLLVLFSSTPLLPWRYVSWLLALACFALIIPPLARARAKWLVRHPKKSKRKAPKPELES